MINPTPVMKTIHYTRKSLESSEDENLVDGLRILMSEVNHICERLGTLSVDISIQDNRTSINTPSKRFEVMAEKRIKL